MQHCEGYWRRPQIDGQMSQSHREHGDSAMRDGVYGPTIPSFVPPSTRAPSQRFRRNSTGSQDASSRGANQSDSSGDGAYDSFRRVLSSNRDDLYSHEEEFSGLTSSSGFRKDQYTNRLYDRLRNNAVGDRRNRFSGEGENSNDAAGGATYGNNAGVAGGGGGGRPGGPSSQATTRSIAPVEVFSSPRSISGSDTSGYSAKPSGVAHFSSGSRIGRAASSSSPVSSILASSVHTSAVLSDKQNARFQEYMQASPVGHRLAQLKVLELAQFWMTAPGTRDRIDAAIQSALQEAREAPVVRQAWGAEASPLKPTQQRFNKGEGATEDRGGVEFPRSPVAPKPHSPDKMTSTSSASGGGGAAGGAEDIKETSLPALVSPVHSGHPTKGGESGDVTPHAPKSTTPSKRDAQDAGSVSTGVGDGEHNGCPLGMMAPPPPLMDDRDSQRSGSNTQPFRRAHSPGGTDLTTVTPPTLPSPVSPRVRDTAIEASPRGHVLNGEQSPTSQQPDPVPLPLSAVEAPPPVVSPRRPTSYEAIPRFYFPLGKPSTRESIIIAPLSASSENPHLKIPEGLSLLGAMYDGEKGVPTRPAGMALQATPKASQSAPLSTLRSVDDRNVHAFIQKEFGRLPAPPKPQQKVRLLSGRMRGSSGSLNASLAKQEATYRNHMLQCLQRICVQCFGVPRYFSFIILRLLQMDYLGMMSSTPSSRSGGRNASSPSLSSIATSQNPSGSSYITMQHVKDFYDAHLRGKDSVRRVFDLIIMSSRLVGGNSSSSRSESPPPAGMYGASPPGSVSRSHLLPEDFVAYIEVLLLHHPGLAFLRQTPDFQSKYLDTVIYRIFYEVDRFDRGRISYAEFATSRLMDAFRQVDASDDINSVLLFFSYEHFYVLYCRFWELDEDRDMMLSQADLIHYAPEDIMNPLIVQRVFSGAGRKVRCQVKNRIGYEDFVWFCLSEEDKSTPQAIRYWFRILDLDGDALLSVYELRTFYDATRAKIAQYVQDSAVDFGDVICQVFDMMRCKEYNGLPLSGLLRDPEAAYVALNMLTNVVKFLQFEQRDPFVAHQERLLGGPEQTPWDRFARVEYDRMAQEADE